MRAHLVTAPGDGVAPAVLLSLPGGSGGGGSGSGTGHLAAQYLFNVPEGFSRLVLEHKLRPGAGLRAVFACDPSSCLAGVGGLLMRLRGEGHGQLHVVAPPGAQASVCSLRHFVHWRHPAVLLEEASAIEAQPTVYQDDQIAVAALWKPAVLAAIWPAPVWLQQSQPASTAAAPVPVPSSSGESTSSDDSSDGGGSSDASVESSSDGQSSSSNEGSGSDESSDSDDSDDSDSETNAAFPPGGSSTAIPNSRSASGQPKRGGIQPGSSAGAGTAAGGEGKAGDRAGVFDALDKLFMSGGGSSRNARRLALDSLREAAAAATAGIRGSSGAAGTTTSAAAACLAAAAGSRQPGAAAVAAAAAATTAAAHPAPSRRRQQGQAASAGGSGDVAVVGGKRFQRLPEGAGINVWVCQKLSGKPAAAAAAAAPSGPPTAAQRLLPAAPGQHGPSLAPTAVQPPPPQQQQVLGFLCHLRASDQLLLLTNVHSRAAAAQLQEHPALPLLLQQHTRVAAVLHLAAPGVVGSRPFRQLCQQLQPAVAQAAGGQQLVLELPGGPSSNQVIGHLAAARTSAKLNLISSRLFPLPAGIQQPPPPADTLRSHDAGAASSAAAPAQAAAQPAIATQGAAVEPAVAAVSAAAVRAVDASKPPAQQPVLQSSTAGKQGPGEAAPRQAVQQEGACHGVEAAGGAGHSNGASSGGSGDSLIQVRHVSLLSWPVQGGQQVGTPAASRLVVEPVEGFSGLAELTGGSGGFDAGAVQHKVLQERPQLREQLQQLSERQQQGQLPGRDVLAPAACPAWRCRQNRVAPPPPPPMPAPVPQLAVGVAPQSGLAPTASFNYAAWQQQQQAIPAQLLVPWGQQQLQPQLQPQPIPAAGVMSGGQQQQPRIMRALYQYQQPLPDALAGQHVLPAAAAASTVYFQQVQPVRQLQPGAPPLPAEQQAEHAPWVSVPGCEPSQADGQPEAGPTNKRAAEGLRARLQDAKRSRQQAEAGLPGLQQLQQQETQQPGQQVQQAQQHETRQPEQQAQQQQQQQHDGAGVQWLAGAPPNVSQLAAGANHGSADWGGPEVLFLGTGSAEPSKYRAASAIQLRLSCGQSLLLDCGEGALGGLCRMHGTAVALRQVASLGCLWVSHRHADHMSGVLPLLAAYPATLPPLLVVGPRSLRDWLVEAAAPLRLAGRYRFVHCLELNQPGHWARQALQHHLGLSHIQCVPVRHCSDAYGLVLRHAVEGWSLVYSGDTQPCQQLVQAGQGCTLLIHEATFEPCLEQQARQKRHSTTAEALAVAQRMGAYRCILTHFSQRYPRWPEGLRQAGEAGAAGSMSGNDAAATAAVAFDGMRVPLVLLPVLPALMPAVQAALEEVEENAEDTLATADPVELVAAGAPAVAAPH